MFIKNFSAYFFRFIFLHNVWQDLLNNILIDFLCYLIKNNHDAFLDISIAISSFWYSVSTEHLFIFEVMYFINCVFVKLE